MAKDSVDPVERLRQNTSVPFEQARAMPVEVYRSQAFVDEELAHIFRKDWFCVGRADALAEPGDYLTCDLAGHPIAVVRDQGGSLRALGNVCLHRMSTLLQGRGNTRAIVCPYHAWTYNLDGALRGAPVSEKLDAAYAEDRGCTEKVYRGLCSDLATPGHLSHLERPNYDFAQYLMARIEAGHN